MNHIISSPRQATQTETARSCGRDRARGLRLTIIDRRSRAPAPPAGQEVSQSVRPIKRMLRPRSEAGGAVVAGQSRAGLAAGGDSRIESGVQAQPQSRSSVWSSTWIRSCSSLRTSPCRNRNRTGSMSRASISPLNPARVELRPDTCEPFQAPKNCSPSRSSPSRQVAGSGAAAGVGPVRAPRSPGPRHAAARPAVARLGLGLRRGAVLGYAVEQGCLLWRMQVPGCRRIPAQDAGGLSIDVPSSPSPSI